MANKEYSNGEITILWKPEKCIHSAICVKTLPKVYNPKEKPWIKLENASPEELIHQVAKCPSGALSIKQENQMLIKVEREDNGKKGRFVVYQNNEFAGEMTYVWAGTSKFIIDHTGIEESFSGRGLGKQLVMKAVEYARNNALKILPLCPFAKKVFDKEGVELGMSAHKHYQVIESLSSGNSGSFHMDHHIDIKPFMRVFMG